MTVGSSTTSNILNAFNSGTRMEGQGEDAGKTRDDDQNDDSTVVGTEDGPDGDTSQGTLDRQDEDAGKTRDDDQNDDSTVVSTEDGSDGDTSQGTFDLDAVLSGRTDTIDEDVDDDDDDDIEHEVRARRSSFYDLSEIDSNVKMIVIGSSGVGKTTLLHVLSGYPFDETTASLQATIGIDFFTLDYVVNETKSIELEIWDTAGQERYASVMESYFRGARGSACIFVYAVNDPKSFKDLESWISRLEKSIGSNYVGIVIGNKIDLESKVSLDTANQFARQHGMSHLLTTACSKLSVEKAITDLLHLYHQKSQVDPDFKSPKRQFRNSQYTEDSVSLRSNDANPASSAGCLC